MRELRCRSTPDGQSVFSLNEFVVVVDGACSKRKWDILGICQYLPFPNAALKFLIVPCGILIFSVDYPLSANGKLPSDIIVESGKFEKNEENHPRKRYFFPRWAFILWNSLHFWGIFDGGSAVSSACVYPYHRIIYFRSDPWPFWSTIRSMTYSSASSFVAFGYLSLSSPMWFVQRGFSIVTPSGILNVEIRIGGIASLPHGT